MKGLDEKPPVLLEWMLSRIGYFENKYSVAGDFEEIYLEIFRDKGKIHAVSWYISQVMKTIPLLLFNYIYWSTAMFKNQIKIALRNIIRHKSYSLINIMGLSIGLVCSLLIMLYINYEYSFDKFHINHNRIYRVLTEMNIVYQDKTVVNGTPNVIVEVLKNDYPEIEYAAKVYNDPDSDLLKIGNREFNEDGFYFVDPDFFKIFSYPLVDGDPELSLGEPFTILITKEIAKKYFGDENPVGKVLNLNNRYDLKVTGVLEERPENTHLKADIITSFKTYEKIRGDRYSITWDSFNYSSYFLLREGADIQAVENKLQEFAPTKFEDVVKKAVSNFFFQPITEIHFYNDAFMEFETGADKKNVYLFMVAALLILLIACFNYMNLSTARAVTRAKEVGVRKVIGAKRFQLVKQFFGESFIFVLFALIVSLAAARFILPVFNSYISRDIRFSLLSDYTLLLILAGLIIMIAVVSGLYPAFYLSRIRPVKIIRRIVGRDSKSYSVFRNSLVVIQFTISVTLIICSIITFNQLQFIKNMDLGFSRDHIINIQADNSVEKYDVIRDKLSVYPDILEIASSDQTLTGISNAQLGDWDGKSEDERLVIYAIEVDKYFFGLYNIEFTEGGSDLENYLEDGVKRFILNETAVEAMGIENPVGKNFGATGDDQNGIIAGVVKDFNYAPLHMKIAPLYIDLSSSNRWISIKISGERVSETISFLETVWKDIYPKTKFEYRFLDDDLNRMYKSEQRLLKSFNYFTAIAVFIACLGLFGLASFTVERKTKEIGIRKALGASIPTVLLMLIRNFINLVMLGTVISFPLGYFLMSRWLEDFAYKVNIGIATFLFAGTLAALVAVMTISYRVISAARSNPANSLRYE